MLWHGGRGQRARKVPSNMCLTKDELEEELSAHMLLIKMTHTHNSFIYKCGLLPAFETNVKQKPTFTFNQLHSYVTSLRNMRDSHNYLNTTAFRNCRLSSIDAAWFFIEVGDVANITNIV